MTVQNCLVMLWCALLLVAAERTLTNYDHVLSKRSDDASPLEAIVNQLSQSLAQMQARLTALEASNSQDKAQLQARITALETIHNKQVAFFAGSSAEHALANAPIPLSPVFNIGNGFDANQHVFVAPYPGVYLFTFQVFDTHVGDLLVDFMKNSDIVVRMRVFDQVMATSEASAVLVEAAAADRFWLRPDRDATLYTNPHSFLSGVLVTLH